LPSRSVVEGILWVMRTGAPWRDIPRRYPSCSTCFRRFQQWRKDGVLKRALALLRCDLSRGNNDEAFIDGTYILAKNGALLKLLWVPRSAEEPDIEPQDMVS
jgi:transposase